MCRIESQIALKCVHFADVHVKCSSSHAQNTLQPRRQLMKHRIITISIKEKVLIEFGASEMMCVELRAKQL